MIWKEFGEIELEELLQNFKTSAIPSHRNTKDLEFYLLILVLL